MCVLLRIQFDTLQVLMCFWEDSRVAEESDRADSGADVVSSVWATLGDEGIGSVRL